MQSGIGKLSPLAEIAPYPLDVLTGATLTMNIADDVLNVVDPQFLRLTPIRRQ